MHKNCEQNIAAETSWPATPPCLSETNLSLWKVLCIGKKGEMKAITLKEEGRYASYKVSEQLNLCVAEESKWTFRSTGGRSGGHVSGTGCKFWFKTLDELPPNWQDEWRSAEYCSTPPSLLTNGGTISVGGKSPSTRGKKKDAGVAQVFAAGSASVEHTMAPIVPKKVPQACVAPLVPFVLFNLQL